MKILQLTKKFPYPLKDGESIAVTNLSRSMAELGCDITLLSMNTVKHYIDPDKIPSSFDHYKEIHLVELDNRVTITGALKNLFTKDSYHVSRFFFDDFRKKLTDLLTNNVYDIIQLETLYLAPYIDLIRKHSDAKIVMRSHNLEYEIWNRITSNTRNFLKKIYLRYLTNKLKRFELEAMHKYNPLVNVTQRDLDAHINSGYSGKGMSLPIGIDSSDYTSEVEWRDSQSLSFIGSLDWMPNLEGLDWFLKKVWPLVLKENPQTKLHIAGRNTPESIRSLSSESIIVEGEVEDAHTFIQQHSVMIVPLLSGSGMRVKILEGMILSRVVVSTSVGMEGIPAINKQHILKADTITDFANQLNWLLKNTVKAKEIASNARSFITEHFDQKSNTQKFIDFLKNL